MSVDLLEALRSEQRDLSAPLSTRISSGELLRLKNVARRLDVRIGILARIAIVRALPELERAAENPGALLRPNGETTPPVASHGQVRP